MSLKGNPMAREMNEMKEKTAKEIRRLKELQDMLVSRLEAVETSQRRGMLLGNVSDLREEGEEENEEEDEDELDPDEKRMAKLLREIKVDKHKIKIDLPMYGGNLNEEEFLDWIAALNNYFECEDVLEEQKVKIEKKLKGYALL